MIALSSRLEAVLTAAGPCGLLADVCADHALVALAAVARGAATHAVAVELRRAPLAQAARYLRSSGLERRVLLVRGAGLAAVRRAEVIVVAGVGGDLAAELLAAGGACGGAARVIVQPNRHSREVRAWALGAGFHLVAERAVAEGAQLHLVLSFVRKGGGDPAYGARPAEAELLLGPLLLASTEPADRLFLRRELRRLRALDGRRPDLACARVALEELFRAEA
jgi:tRNA (adenine22-N1)-methyltransferase